MPSPLLLQVLRSDLERPSRPGFRDDQHYRQSLLFPYLTHMPAFTNFKLDACSSFNTSHLSSRAGSLMLG